MFNWIKALLLSLPHAEQTQSERERKRERERGVRRWTERERREREREGVARAEQSRLRESEREMWCVAVRWESNTSLPLARQYRWFSETRFGRFLKGKKSLKWSANVPKLATLVHLHFSNKGFDHGSNRKYLCVNRALKKLVPLKMSLR